MVNPFWKYGRGRGSGYGSGDGSGHASGSGHACGYRIKGYFAIDNILCKLLNQKRGSYKVETFPQRKICYLADYQGEIAHGDTLREAQEEAKRKYFSGLTFEENKKRFLQEFEKKQKLSGKDLYEWHGILTGSCKFGRDRFCEQHNIDLRKKYTLREFVEIVKDDFGGDKIKQLLER